MTATSSDRTFATAPSCQDDYDSVSLTVAEAAGRIQERMRPIDGVEALPLRAAFGRVLAEDVRSSIDVPTGTNSAMDGYALCGAELPAQGTRTFRPVGSAFAGHPYGKPISPGECVRIMTGALLPKGADTVVIQEHAEVSGENVRIGTHTQPGANVRRAGEDIAAGQIVLRRGRRLTAADLGLLASLGTDKATVTRPLKVAYFSTGDELRSSGDPLEPGTIYDSNRYTLHGMLSRPGIESLDLGVVRDVRERVERAFEEAARCADVVLSSGGVSVGEADLVRETLSRLGQIDFWKVAMKPGRPLAFGRIGNAWFFGLPGNPVSVMVTYQQLVEPALRQLEGEHVERPLQFEVPCISRLRKRPGRIEYQRGVLQRGEDGQLVVARTGAQGSGILRSMSEANCYIVLPMDSGGVEPGTTVTVQPFSSAI